MAARIDALFAIEREINGAEPAERVARVRNAANPRSMSSPSGCASSMRASRPGARSARRSTYSLKAWNALVRVLDDGRLCMSDNAAERAMRPVATGRRNWTFAGSDEGGRRAPTIYSLIQIAKIKDVGPLAWLADVLARIQNHSAKRIDDLFPWNWTTARLQRAAA